MYFTLKSSLGESPVTTQNLETPTGIPKATMIAAATEITSSYAATTVMISETPTTVTLAGEKICVSYS